MAVEGLPIEMETSNIIDRFDVISIVIEAVT